MYLQHVGSRFGKKTSPIISRIRLSIILCLTALQSMKTASGHLVNMRHWTNVCLMLSQRCKLCTGINTTLARCFVISWQPVHLLNSHTKHEMLAQWWVMLGRRSRQWNNIRWALGVLDALNQLLLHTLRTGSLSECIEHTNYTQK